MLVQNDQVKNDSKVVNENKILKNLKNIEVKFEDENETLLLLNILSKKNEHFKDVLLLKNNIIILEVVQT